MRFIVGILLTYTCGCTDLIPKYRYMDCVQITEGFYKGSAGYVTNWYYTKDLYIVHSYRSSDVYDEIKPESLILVANCEFEKGK